MKLSSTSTATRVQLLALNRCESRLAIAQLNRSGLLTMARTQVVNSYSLYPGHLVKQLHELSMKACLCIILRR